MANYLTHAINQFLSADWTVLDLCCGNGLVSDGFVCSQITGVDVYPPYLEQYRAKVRNSTTLERDLKAITHGERDIPPASYDVVVCADGVEHLDPQPSLQLIGWMERVARRRVVIFTPLNIQHPGGIVLNTPHDAWGIAGGDSWQTHRCGYAPEFFLARGYKAYRLNVHENAYDGTPYAEMLYVLEVPTVPAIAAPPARSTLAFGRFVPGSCAGP